MALVMKATQKVDLSIAFKDRKGNAANVDGVPAWGISDPSLGTLTVAEDGMSATLAAGTPGTGQVNVTADADLGEGVTAIVGVLDVEVLPAEAAIVEINAGAPTEQE